jgi:hypothetical protein
MLTVIETCRQQGRDVLAFLSATIQAHLAHQPAPALLSEVRTGPRACEAFLSELPAVSGRSPGAAVCASG